MMHLGDIAKICGGTLHPTDAATTAANHAVIDSRRLQSGDVFVALPGNNAHGHSFLSQARVRGAAAAIVEEKQADDIAQIVVDDSRTALVQWAQARRAQYDDTVIAITGSNGKTTVKEMTAAICRAAYGDSAVLCSSGNYNNELGVSLTVLSLENNHRILVAEVGMDAAGEITRLKEILQPHIMLINNAQRAHIGNFDSLTDIARAKGELVAGENGIAILNGDDAHYQLWRDIAKAHQIISFGLSGSVQVRGQATAGGVAVGGMTIPLRVLGAHNVANATAAAAVGRALGIDAGAITRGLSAFAGVPGRLQLRTLIGGGTLIDDTYNANPDSVLAAAAVLRTQARALSQTPLLVLGDMLALGDGAHTLHKDVISDCRERGLEVFGVGEMMSAVLRDLKLPIFADKESLVAALHERTQKEPCCVLVKGSRGMTMETVAQALTDHTPASKVGGLAQ